MAFRSKASHRIIFEGQSLNNAPPDEGSILGHGYPWHLMRGLGLPYNIPAVSGTPLYNGGSGDLYSDLDTRVFPLIGRDLKTIVIICGGTTDVTLNETGSEMYDDHVQHAEALYAAGADYVLTTTICAANHFTAPQDAERIICNNLLLTNADSVFSGVVDLMSTPLEDPSDQSGDEGYQNDYYFDGVHWYDPGAIVCANAVRPYLTTLLNL